MSDLTVLPEEIPDWLTDNFLRELLPISGDFRLKRIEHACSKGDNFASKIYRVELNFAVGDTKTLIVKSSPIEDGFSKEFLKKFNIFSKEIEMYEIVELFEKHFHTIGHEITFAPK